MVLKKQLPSGVVGGMWALSVWLFSPVSLEGNKSQAMNILYIFYESENCNKNLRNRKQLSAGNHTKSG